MNSLVLVSTGKQQTQPFGAGLEVTIGDELPSETYNSTDVFAWPERLTRTIQLVQPIPAHLSPSREVQGATSTAKFAGAKIQVQHYLESFASAGVALTYSRENRSRGESGDRSQHAEFRASRELTEQYLTSLAWELEDVELHAPPFSVEVRDKQLPHLEDPLDFLQEHLGERVTDILATLAYRAAAENRSLVPLSDKNLRFASSVARELIDGLLVDPYLAPRFLTELAAELELSAMRGEMQASWGILRSVPAGLNLQVLATFERLPSKGPRARIIGGLSIG